MSEFSLEGIAPLASGGSGIVHKKDMASGFATLLEQNIEDTNNLLNKADMMVQDFSVEKTVNLHEVMAAVEEASLALHFTMQVRNKAIEGYQEIMRMNV
jgi:flagellar hook-basal body complex protein FliE